MTSLRSASASRGLNDTDSLASSLIAPLSTFRLYQRQLKTS